MMWSMVDDRDTTRATTGRVTPAMVSDTDAPTIAAATAGGSSTGTLVAMDDAGYELRDVLGRGGMGEVVAARDRKVGREVALKRLRVATPTHDEIARFLREGQIQAWLEHPAIVPVHDLGYDAAGQPYFTMKRISGDTLGDLIARSSATLQRMLRAFVDVCLAIELAHSRGVVHRDLKPANVMLGNFGEVYVLDWGIARVTGRSEREEAGIVIDDRLDAETAAGVTLGTPGYMAPEQIQDSSSVGPPADVYALGAVLFEILAAQPLHPRGEAAMAATLSGVVESPARRRADRAIPPELDAACMAALATSPEARPTARDLGDRVQRYLDGDRDLERRRALAAEQLATAHAALATGNASSRAQAMRAAGHAVVLDPSSVEAADLASSLVLVPPKDLPPELRERLIADDRELSSWRHRRGAKAYASVYLLAPLILLLDLRNWSLFLAFNVMLGVMALVGLRSSRLAEPSLAPTLVGNFVMALLFARVIGPFMIMPIVVCGVVIVITQNPWLNERPVAVLSWVVATMMGPFVLEWLGVFSPTWRVEEGAVVSMSAMFGIHGTVEAVALIVVNVALIMVVAMFALGVNRDRSDAHRTLRILAWHLAHLLPTDGARRVTGRHE